MPVYEYRCENGHEFEVLQRMNDPAAAECTTCGAPVQRIFRPPAIHFKGSGFYNTDYGKRKRGGGESADGAGAGSSDGGGGESKTEKRGDQKGDKKDGSSSGSGSGSSGSSDSGSSKKSETAA